MALVPAILYKDEIKKQILATVGLFSALKKSQVPVRCNIS